MNYYPEFSRLLNDYLAQTDRSPTWLARQLGVNPSTVTRWLNHSTRPANPELVVQIADALGRASEQEPLLVAAGYGYQPAATTTAALTPPTPPAQAIHSSAPRYHDNLPTPPTSLIGRQTELAAVTALLQQQDVWIVTLSGPGGSGKTRLALAIGAAIATNAVRDVYFIKLAPLQNPELVLPTIANVLELTEIDGQSLAVALAHYLRDRQMLLILDNFEQVATAARHLAELHRQAPSILLLVTSRSPLQVRGEREIFVPPLILPGPTDSLAIIKACEAVRLFTARMQDVQPDFALTEENASTVAALCAKLDGLPLAIELAAARGRVLSIEALLGRLDNPLDLLTRGPQDLPDRQQTLRATIGWSVTLLTATEQHLFRRLGIFYGGFTLASAEAVCNVDGDLGDDLLESLTTLVEQHLVQLVRDRRQGEGRYTMLETIRAFAHEQLAMSDEAELIRERHAIHFCALAKQGNELGHGPEQGVWLARLEIELNNFRAVLSWSQHTAGQTELGLHLVDALYYLWRSRGHVAEGREWATALLANPQATIATEVRANASRTAGLLAVIQGDDATARLLLEESVALWRTLDNQQSLAVSLMCLIESDCVDGDQFTAIYEECLALFRALDDAWGIALLQSNQANRAFMLHKYEQAEAMWAEALVSMRKVGDKNGVASLLLRLGDLAFMRNELERTERFYAECLSLVSELDETWVYPDLLISQGKLANAQRRFGQASALFKECLALSRQTGAAYAIAASLCGLGDLARCQNDYQQANLYYRESLSLYQQSDDQEQVAWLQHHLGHVAAAQGEYLRAKAHFNSSLLFFRQSGDERGVAHCQAGLACVHGMATEWTAAAQLLNAAAAKLEGISPRMAPADFDAYQRTVVLVQGHVIAPNVI
ncbi:MAG: tetratricopeptide repeat protein [Caldilineaceae bacterium]|nr:tetratricopeptide repeat protein [Caldilineaceae bacterium]